MNTLTLLLILAMLATTLALGMGLFSFFKGGEFNARYGNKLMQARVGLQALAVLIIALIVFATTGG